MKTHVSSLRGLCLILMALLLLGGCRSNPLAVITPTALSPTSTFLDSFSHSDQFGDQYVSLLPVRDLETLAGEEIVRLLLVQWLDHYQNDCQDSFYRLQAYTVHTINLAPADQGYEIVTKVAFDVLPVQPLTADYAGETAPNGWVSFAGPFLPDGTLETGGVFGVFREDDHFRLRMLVGWGT